MSFTFAQQLSLRASQTAADYIAACTTSPTPNRVVIGGAIADPTRPCVLIVQRASNERTFPNEWEIPGGHVDPGETILEAVSREIAEETGLDITHVVCEFEGFQYSSIKNGDDNGEGSRVVVTDQLNFCVRVKDTACVRLCPEEHQKYAWCDEDNIDQFKMTPPMRKVVADSLAALAACAAE
ncbi:NUDIX hydrolase domain-like protein [Kickxella alabastrina]|uniref:NUDIX hydrolase domain-like protein n=1 Tax=Kickxella alabastrina TaxID=61397 RepID=UPI002220240A|nr:NUDIX hydrolase domain-like protein [Kickxella alabastrina]KAI7824561.1 NUDIX hydrolase domain-like protein [Kickxella alabastrina]